VLPHLDRADVERALFDGPSKVIDIGVRRRLFTGATRTAIQLRDRVCTHPSCDWPAEDCEIDHITPYSDGGETTQDNGRCLCRYHHRWRHQEHPRRRPQPVA
jgi:5-methylcytosine-specific restriction endonuclease McrA